MTIQTSRKTRGLAIYGRFLAATLLAGLAGACDGLPGGDVSSSTPSSVSEAPSAEAMLADAVDGPHRSAEERARDEWRRPKETLAFFGVAPDMTVVEVWPGGGWYTNILSPYLSSGGGVLYAAHFDPARGPAAAEAVAAFKRSFAASDDQGVVRITAFAPGAAAPVASADAVLTFRNVHNWLDSNNAGAAFDEFFRVLKPGGVLGVVDHRANGDQKDGRSHGGYVTEASVVALAAAAGFTFEASSDINANPADTKDHPFGVWTLPPVRRSADAPGKRTADFPRAKYDAIGESDRMTLRFRKPAQNAPQEIEEASH